MCFAEIDGPFSKWAQENDLSIQSIYQNLETRSVEFVTQSGKLVELWISHTDDEGIFDIKAKSDTGFRKSYQVHSRELYKQLKIFYIELKEL